MDRVYITEDYKWEGVTGYCYTPYVEDGKWYLVGRLDHSFDSIVHMLGIPEDEAIVMKLKYGGK